MKKIKILVGTILLATISYGLMAWSLRTDPPQKVKDAFAQKFPSVKSANWDKESETEWEAEFKIKGVEYSANFLEDGKWVETEHEISMKDVPAKIKTSLTKEFPGYKVGEVEISETDKGSVYEFEIEKGDDEMEVGIDQTGKIVKKEMKESEEDKD